MIGRYTRADVLKLLGGAVLNAPMATRSALAQAAQVPAGAGLSGPIDIIPPEYSVLDARVMPGQREVIVRVRRNKPTFYSLAMRFFVRRGGGLLSFNSPEAYRTGDFVFDYDVDEIQIPIDIGRDLEGQVLTVELAKPRAYGDIDTLSDPGVSTAAFSTRFARAKATISATAPDVPPLPATAVSRRWNQPIDRAVPADWTCDFSSDLVNGFEANDRGRNSNGAPCFRSSLAHGRMQNNGEVGLYTDPVLYPQTHPYQMINGQRALVAEKLPEPVPYMVGSQPKIATYASPIVSTETMPRFGYGRFSYKFALPSPTIGMWPAGWQLALPHWRWPDPEHDTVEISFTQADPKQVMPYQTHWWGRPGRGAKQGQFVDVHELFSNFKYSDQHEYWCDWTPEVIRWGIDHILTFSAPNRYFLKDPQASSDPNRLYMILQIAIGGGGGNPDLGTYPSAMVVDHIAHYAMPTG